LVASPKKSIDTTPATLGVHVKMQVAETSTPSALKAAARTATDVQRVANVAAAEHADGFAWSQTATRSTLPGVTVRTAVPLNPPADAVIVTEPAVLATTRPLSLTDAMPELELVHVMEGLASGPVVAAVNWTDWPRMSAAVAGLTVTDVTPDVTVMLAVPLNPPADAVTVAVPAALATSCPTSETDTTFGFELTHVIVGLASGPVVVATS
jgi:hypothetical protein